MAVGALAVTAFAACSDDDTDTPGEIETPSDTGLGGLDTPPTTPTS